MVAHMGRSEERKMSRVLLMTVGDPTRVVRLAEQIERRVSGVKICGILHKISKQSRPGIATRMKQSLRSLASRVGHLTLDLIHGSRVGQIGGSARDLLSECNERGWTFYTVEEMSSPQVLKFARQQDADLGVALGLDPLPEALAAIPEQGSIEGQIFSYDRRGSRSTTAQKAINNTRGIRVNVYRISRERKKLLLASLDLAPQPLDTAVSLELKSNLILRDLLVQSVAVVAQRTNPEAAAAQIGAWIRDTFPSYLTQSQERMFSGSSDRFPPFRIRSKWKLYAYSLLLFSPWVLLRNWLYRWGSQYPVLFLNHHLISDRYHRMALSTEAFLRQVRFLQRHYRIVTLCEATTLLQSGSVREPTVVLTFDDGYEDNFLSLRAVAEETGVPVALFVVTQIVTQHKQFTHDIEGRQAGFCALTWDQIRYWSSDNAEFGSHTCSHYDCGSTDPTALEQEIVESKRELESQLAEDVIAFAFPFGKPENMSPLARTIAAKTYDHFLSFFGGENLPNRSELHKHLFRKPLHGNAWENELELQNVFEIAASLKRLARLNYKGFNKLPLPAQERSRTPDPHPTSRQAPE